MFGYASSFNQDISNWCVTNITLEPSFFSDESPLSESNMPVWGTCPSITAILDPNFEEALIQLGLDSGEIDGQVLTANISDVTSLIVNNKNIESLTGIEDFTALTNLSCNNNLLTGLNVRANTALTTLFCETNRLTILDVSQNTALEYLECTNNQLTSLDLSGNANLIELVCNSNELTELIVSSNTALTKLFCETNLLTTLDVSQNTALEYLECANNQLTSLDLSGNANLIELVCDSNELTELIVSSNPALEILVSYDNQLTELIVSSNPALKILTCNSNSLTTLDLSSSPNLEILSVGNNQLETLDIRNGNNASITYFNSTNNPNLSCIFVDNPSGINDTWEIDTDTFFVADEAECKALSIADHGFELGLFVYPNPTDNYLLIGGGKTPASISIYNLLGKKVLSVKNTHSVDVKELSDGVYFIRISDGMGQVERHFIKN
tara:strand:- start:1603 stop:2922 length:1320 start_codon:yes stop_codon:yes gene_type:complete